MDAVARRARASKATLYRRWDTKPSLVVDAMVRAKQAPAVEDHDTGSLRGDLVSTFCGPHGIAHGKAATGARLGDHRPDRATRSSPRCSARSSSRPKLEVSRAIYARAVDRGEIADDVDLEIIAPALAGILLHRSFVMGLEPDDETVERVIDHVILPAVGYRPRTAYHHSGPHPGPERPGPHDRHHDPDVTEPTTPKSPSRRLGWALVLISVAQLMVVLDGTIVNIALPYIQEDLRHRQRQPALGRHRLRPGLRQPAAARRPPRRPLRPPQGLHDRPGHLRRRLAARRPRHQRGPPAGRPWRCRASAPRWPPRPRSR